MGAQSNNQMEVGIKSYNQGNYLPQSTTMLNHHVTVYSNVTIKGNYNVTMLKIYNQKNYLLHVELQYKTVVHFQSLSSV